MQQLPRPFTLDQCAAHCQSFSDLTGHVGFDTNGGACMCRYSVGTGPVSFTSTEGLAYSTHAMGGYDKGAGAIGGADGATNQNLCYRHNAFGGAYIGLDAYTGSDFTLLGQGHCAPQGSTTSYLDYRSWDFHYSHGPALYPPYSMDDCAAFCLGFPNTEGLVGVETRASDCFCRYTDGTGPESATTEEGLLYNTDTSGPVGRTDGSPWVFCWAYNWALGNVSVRLLIDLLDLAQSQPYFQTAPPTIGVSRLP